MCVLNLFLNRNITILLCILKQVLMLLKTINESIGSIKAKKVWSCTCFMLFLFQCLEFIDGTPNSYIFNCDLNRFFVIGIIITLNIICYFISSYTYRIICTRGAATQFFWFCVLIVNHYIENLIITVNTTIHLILETNHN